jgi:outer membrane protein TolC
MTHQGDTCFYRSLLLGLLVLWSWSGMVAAAEEPTETNLDLSALIREAVEHNPEIQAAEQRYRAAQARPSQAGSLVS